MTLSHEFRGPLAAIRGWVQMAEKGMIPAEKLPHALAVIGRNAASLSDMIEHVFDVSRSAAGSLVLDRGRVDLNPLVRLVVESSQPSAREHGVALTLRGTRGRLLVNGDAVRLEQVVRNLVENAIKFTPSGGHVHVQITGHRTFAELAVNDNGRGITPEMLPRIFEAFRHDHRSIRSSERGLGLGLALVRELVHLHDGEVRAVSGGAGQGSTFIVRLPLARSAAAA
jgi:signal transduction histidine kinase